MSEGVEQVESGVAAVRAGLDTLLHADIAVGGPAVALQALRQLEIEQRRLAVVGHALVAEIARQHPSDGTAGVAAVLVSELRLSPAEARARVNAARDLGPRQTLAGERLNPIFEHAAAAQAAGLISTSHTREIVTAIDRLPGDVAAELGITVEQILTDAATKTNPVLLRRFAHDLITRLDPDGTEPNDQQQRRDRGLWLAVRADGSADLSARLTAATTAVWTTLLDAVSAPQPADDDQPDPRTATQRRHDALLGLGQRLLRSGALPDTGGIPVTILATLTTNQLTHAASTDPATATATATATSPKTGPAHAGHARTAHGHPISLTQLLELSDEAHLVTVTLDPHGAVCTLGRDRRLATPTQRLALAARDHGCSFPGCTRPPAWCQAHHVIAWIDGGRTILTNLTLLCSYHHREFARQGWTCRITNGRPEWIPPAWIEPDQKPRRNTAHHYDPLLAASDRASSTGPTSAAASPVVGRQPRAPAGVT